MADDPLVLLSERERVVFYFLVEGLRLKDIASRLDLSTKTVEAHRANIMRKLGINDLAGLVKLAVKMKLLEFQTEHELQGTVRLAGGVPRRGRLPALSRRFQRRRAPDLKG